MSRYIRNYEIVRQIGSGHFGQVYIGVGEVPGRGLNAGKRRMVAIKQLHRPDPHHVELLVREFELLDEVKHRGIVRVFEFLKEDHAVVMEYVHGITLRQLLDECRAAREQVFTEAAIEMVCELADALYQAWTSPSDNGEPLQLVHRDLKPENIMITPRGEIKILDFGLARVDNKEYAPESNDRIKGTPVYMSPEQASGQLVDHRSDLFSLGLIAYELFMGRPAYTVSQNSRDPLGEIFDAIERGALHEQVHELESKLPGVGPIIARLLQSNPNNRYQTGQDLLVDLRRQLYRDRGSYLGEFCEFFFGSLYDLPEAPSPEANFGSGSSAQASRSGSGKRMSMEERLRASMARDAQAKRTAEKPSTWRGAGRSPRRSGSSSGGVGGVGGVSAGGVSGGAPSSGVPGRTGSGSGRVSGGVSGGRVSGAGARSSRSVSGGGASGGRGAGRSVPPPPPSRLRTEAPKAVGHRSPSDPGMLGFVDIDQGFGGEIGGGDSATAFFAIPQLKEAARPTAPAAPAAAPPLATPVVAAAAGSAAPVAIAQGPVAAGPVAEYRAGGPVVPQAAGAAPVPPPANDSGRTESKRVAVIILGMFMMLGVATFLAIWGSTLLGDDTDDGRGAAIVEMRDASSQGSSKGGSSAPAEPSLRDTGAPATQPKAPPTTSGGGRTNKGTKVGGRSSSSGGGAAAAPKVASGSLAIKVTGGPTSVTLQCGDGTRSKAAISGGRASFGSVPSSGCKITFSGHGAKAVFNGVGGGRSITCTVDGGTANCR